MQNQLLKHLRCLFYIGFTVVLCGPFQGVNAQDASTLRVLEQSAQLKQAFSLRWKQPAQAMDIAQQALNVDGTQLNPGLQIHVLYINSAAQKALKNHQLAIKLSKEVIEQAQKASFPWLVADSLVNVSDSYRQLKQYERATEFAMRARNLSERIDAKVERDKSILILGRISRDSKEYDNAIAYLHELANIAQEDVNVEYIIKAYSGIAEVYKKRRDFETAIEFYKKALPLLDKSDDTKQVGMVYLDLFKIYKTIESNENALLFGKKALEIYEAQGNSEKVMGILGALAIIERRLGNYEEALLHSHKSLAFQRLDADKDGIAQSLLNLSITYMKLSSYDLALKYALELSDFNEKNNDLNSIAITGNQIGFIYFRLDNYDEAQKYYEATLSLPTDKVKGLYRAAATRGLADLFHALGNQDRALVYAEKAKRLYEKSNNLQGVSAIYRTMGRIYLELSEKKKALTYFEKGASSARSIGQKWGEASSLIHMGGILVNEKPDVAMKHTLRGLQIAKDIDAKSIQLEGLNNYAAILKQRGDFQKAFTVLEQRYILNKEITQAETNKRIAELQVVHQVDQSEREIDALRNQALIDELELSRQATELDMLTKDKTISELQLVQERNTRVILLSLFGLVILALLLLFMRYRYAAKMQTTLQLKNQDIEAKNHKLEELNATKDRFFSIISHDLRSPVSAQVSLTEMLKAELGEFSRSEIKTYIDAIHDSTVQTQKLLDDLLAWAMAQLRNSEPIPRMHSAKKLTDAVIDVLSVVAKSKKIVIANDIDDSAMLYADKNMVNTVLRNLLSNALKFSPEGGLIQVYSENDQNFTVIHVRDVGGGIPEQDIPKLFSIDTNCSRSGTEGEKGAGFGLPLCKDLLLKNGGDIEVSTEKNEGSDFFIRLPMKKAV